MISADSIIWFILVQNTVCLSCIKIDYIPNPESSMIANGLEDLATQSTNNALPFTFFSRLQILLQFLAEEILHCFGFHSCSR